MTVYLSGSRLIYAAIDLARLAHKGQKRRDGSDYFSSHIEGVVDILVYHWNELLPGSFLSSQNGYDTSIKDATVAATYLHDILEDTKYTENDLVKMGFPPLTIDIVKAVTRKKGQTYADFILSLLDSGPHSVLAKAVKLADLQHNMSDNLQEGSMKDKYRLASYILSPSGKKFHDVFV